MLRRILSLAILIGVMAAILATPATAAPQAVGREERNGVMYTVYEERKPGDPNLYLYYVEDGAMGGGSSNSLRFYKRENGMESVAFIAVTLLFAASVLAVNRRANLMSLLHR